MVGKNSNDHAGGVPHNELASRLSRNIAARRKELGLTQAQLAEQLDVDTETLSRFERGKHLPSLVTLERLAALLSTTVSDLLSNGGVTPSDGALLLANRLAALDPEDRQCVLRMFKRDFLIGQKPQL